MGSLLQKVLTCSSGDPMHKAQITLEAQSSAQDTATALRHLKFHLPFMSCHSNSYLGLAICAHHCSKPLMALKLYTLFTLLGHTDFFMSAAKAAKCIDSCASQEGAHLQPPGNALVLEWKSSALIRAARISYPETES